jgi:hypothetical protein
MSQEELNGSEVRAALQEVGGKAMAEGVDGDVLSQPCGTGGLDAGPIDRRVGHGTIQGLPGKEPVARAGRLPVGAEDVQEPWREHHIAVLAALALANMDDHPLAVDVVDTQRDDL